MNKFHEFKNKITNGCRLSAEEAMWLWENMPLMSLAELAVEAKKRASGEVVFYNRNFHIEPTNICTYNCKFCSFKRPASSSEAWCMTKEEIVRYAEERYSDHITEIHLVGGVHPSQKFEDYEQVIDQLKQRFPGVSLKAFSAIEHIYAIEKAGLSYAEGVKRLVAAGLDSITGGGAEIFDPEIRQKICPDKPDAKKWLAMHEALHSEGIKTNATMLYGHIEGVHHRIDHLMQLRQLQDKTAGFNAFIPLKYRHEGNNLGVVGECSIIEDLKTIAISRLVLDNIPHIKAYYPMFGKNISELALLAGADDLDGAPIETTKIYSMAGVADKSVTVVQIQKMITNAGFTPAERDTFYNSI